MKEWEKKLSPHVSYNTLEAMNRGRTTVTIERLRRQLKEEHERAEDHRRKLAELESDEHVAKVREKVTELRREATKLTAKADRIEADRIAAIDAERAELKRLTGDGGGGI